jgi:hypothetical protein
MTIIVNQSFFADLIFANHKALSAIWPQASHRSNDAALVSKDRGKSLAAGDMMSSHRRAAGQQRSGARSKGSAVKQHRSRQ